MLLLKVRAFHYEISMRERQGQYSKRGDTTCLLVSSREAISTRSASLILQEKLPLPTSHGNFLHAFLTLSENLERALVVYLNKHSLDFKMRRRARPP